MKPLPDEMEVQPLEAARNLALRRLGRMAQTEYQLQSYLLTKGTEAELANQVVARLVEVGLINDLEYARAWIRSRRLIRQAGDSLLRRELKLRGVEAEVVESALAFESVDSEELARDLATRRWTSLSRLAVEDRKRRVVGLLVRRGHSVSTAWRVVGELASTEV